MTLMMKTTNINFVCFHEKYAIELKTGTYFNACKNVKFLRASKKIFSHSLIMSMYTI